MRCGGRNFGKSVFIWLDGYSFVNTSLPHFPVSIIPAYRKLFKGFLRVTLNVFLLDGLQILNFLSNWDFQISMTKINLFFLHVPIRINPINKLKFLFSHFFFPPKDLWRPWYHKEAWKWKFKLIFILTIFFVCFLKCKGQRALTNLFLIVTINLNNVIFQR